MNYVFGVFDKTSVCFSQGFYLKVPSICLFTPQLFSALRRNYFDSNCVK